MLQHSVSHPAWLQHDMEQVNARIRRQLNSEVVLIGQVVDFILHASERVRPALVLAAARALGGGGERACALAAAVELIHISLALHDDVTEASGGGADAHSAGAMFGNAGNILLGDLLYTGAFRMIVDLQDMEVMRVLSNATNAIAEGEVRYRVARGEPAACTPEDWLDIAGQRRARLFEAGAECMAILLGAPPAARQALAGFGRHVGMAQTLETEVEDAARFGVDAAEARAANERAAAQALIRAAGSAVVAEPERLAFFA